MYRSGDQWVVSASDLVNFLHCAHLSHLDAEVVLGRLERPDLDDPEVELLQRKGMEHEERYLAELEASLGGGVVRIEGELEEAAARTAAAMADGAAAIYQATYLDRSAPVIWRAHADFVVRVDRPSVLGPWSYEPKDTKLAHRVRPSAVIQLCHYAEQIAAIQGVEPERIHVGLGGGAGEVSLVTSEHLAYYRAAKARFLQFLTETTPTYPDQVEHCNVCPWSARCEAHRLEDDHLSLVAGLGREHVRKLTRRAGVSTTTALSVLPEDTVVPGTSPSTLARLRRQSRLQLEARTRPGPPPYELLKSDEVGRGLGALPAPSPGDLFFDIEGDPFVEPDGLEYLFGMGWVGDQGFEYRTFWAHDRAEEQAAFESLVDFITERWAQFPDMHVYHYAPYERTVLARLMGRYGTREDEVDDILRGHRLVDLYQVVRQGLCIGTPSYSLKKLEPLYMPRRQGSITDGGSSIVAYERWLETGDRSILEEIAAYNRVDCDSTRRLRDWLEERRADYPDAFGEELARPLSPTDSEADEETAEEQAEVAELRARLQKAAIDADPDEAEALFLLAELLEWHRREAKPDWWAWFHRVLDCGADELFADSEAIAGLTYEGRVGRVARSVVHRYHFEPSQEHKLSAGSGVDDPAGERSRLSGGPGNSPGTIVALDAVAGWLDLKRGEHSAADHPTCLIPGKPFTTVDQRRALRRLAGAVADDGLDGPGRYRAARDLLLRRPPRRSDGGFGPVSSSEASDAVVVTAEALAGGCLAVQGPPGSGKTYTAARTVVSLVAQGRKVGITATSHAVIGNLLKAIIEASEREDIPVRIAQRANQDQAVDDDRVTRCASPQELQARLHNGEADVVAGTAWLFSREAMDGTLDCLVVDEAGQLSLANVLAVATAADNLILVGDPAQLSQPSKGTHPSRAGASALGHVLQDEATIGPELGVFLDRTRRLHPDLCGFISELAYDGRLAAFEATARQSIGGEDGLGGSGLRWVAVEHTGNRTSSEEEAETICGVVRSLIGREWTNQDGQLGILTPYDLLVVAPYNAQVNLLAQCLPDGVRVGTVDKFQGQEAAVAVVSMSASSAEEVPRGLEFLFSRNRLNVAVSRAQALAVVVASPSLLATHCRTPRQLRLVNGLCRFAELAEV